MWSRYIRRPVQTVVGSAVVSVAVTTAVGLALTALSTEVLAQYGVGLFVLTPVALGFVASVVFGFGRPRSVDDCIIVGSVAVVAASVALVAVALEGVICIVMALPLTIPLGIVGALLGYAVQRGADPQANARALSFVVLLPLVMGVESASEPRAPLRSVTTEIVVDAPPAVVWRHVVSVEPLPEPRELVFRLGIAYPTRATITGSGVGAVRRCTFSTGDFVEPITVWEPGRRLEFAVRSQPAPMRELSPWAGLDPPHLDGFLRSERGRFDLVPLGGGRTLVRGTSWYRNRMWPQPYWGLWADALMHRIHRRVLRHVKAHAEADPRAAR